MLDKRVAALLPKIEHPSGSMVAKHLVSCPTCGEMVIKQDLDANGEPAFSAPNFDDKGWYHTKKFLCAKGHTWSEKVRV